MRQLSIVIPTYNYGWLVGEAVESALAVDWPDVEVLVVDDGSTDHSLAVLESFGSRITVIAQENTGPRVACNRGFPESSGDAVTFLASDDVLEPSIARDVAAVWRPQVSKVRYRVHGGNHNGLLADPRRFRQQIERAYLRHQFALEISGRADAHPTDGAVGPLLRGRHLMQMRVAQRRVDPGTSAPIPTGGGRRMLRDTITSVFGPGPESVRHRVGASAWCLVTLLAPAAVARRLLTWRFT